MARSKFRKGDKITIGKGTIFTPIIGCEAIVVAVHPKTSPGGMEYAGYQHGLVIEMIDKKKFEPLGISADHGGPCRLWIHEHNAIPVPRRAK